MISGEGILSFSCFLPSPSGQLLKDRVSSSSQILSFRRRLHIRWAMLSREAYWIWNCTHTPQSKFCEILNL